MDREGALGKRDCDLGLSGIPAHVKWRPLYASATNDNLASIRVLQKCGFMVCGHTKGFAGARGTEIEEVMLELRV